MRGELTQSASSQFVCKYACKFVHKLFKNLIVNCFINLFVNLSVDWFKFVKDNLKTLTLHHCLLLFTISCPLGGLRT